MSLYKKNEDAGQDTPIEAAAQERRADEMEEYEVVAVSSPLPAAAEQTQLPAERTMVRPRKKRNVKRMVIIGVVLLLVVLVATAYVASSLRGPAATMVQTMDVARGDITQTLNTSGVITSGEKMVVYSPVTAPVNMVNVEVGRRVYAGDVMFTYDTTDLARNVQTAQAANNLTGLQNQQAVNQSNEAAQNAAAAGESLDSLRTNRDLAKQWIADYTRQIEEYMASPDGIRLAELQIIMDGWEAQKPLPHDDPIMLADYEADKLEYDRLNAPVLALQSAIAVQQEELVRIESLIASMDAAQQSAEQGVLDGNQMQQQAAQAVSPQVALQQAQENLAKAQNGVTAPISGVITSLEAQEGAAATQYGPLCTIESLSKVDVVVSLSRYDLERVQEGQSATITSLGAEYNGVVSKINRMASTTTTNTGASTFVSAVVSITNPSADITLGIEADVSITTGSGTDVLVVPIASVITDAEGTYVYVAENGVATRRNVVTGMSSDTDVEIVDGLAEGDQLILSSQGLMEGQAVSAAPATADGMPADAPADDAGGEGGVVVESTAA